MAPASRDSDPPGHVAIPKWFAALVGALGLPIVAAGLAIYVQIAQLSADFGAQRGQLTRIESTVTTATTTATEAARATALQTQTLAEHRDRGQRIESLLTDHDRRMRELELVCLPRMSAHGGR
jgi:hypothetical protein